jgi:hypothetical protein
MKNTKVIFANNRMFKRGVKFPSVDAAREDCLRFVERVYRTLPLEAQNRLLHRKGALLWITGFANDISVDATDVFAESTVATRLGLKPCPGEIAVVLSKTDVPWEFVGGHYPHPPPEKAPVNPIPTQRGAVIQGNGLLWYFRGVPLDLSAALGVSWAGTGAESRETAE